MAMPALNSPLFVYFSASRTYHRAGRIGGAKVSGVLVHLATRAARAYVICVVSAAMRESAARHGNIARDS
jgi:hypothetical protein